MEAGRGAAEVAVRAGARDSSCSAEALVRTAMDDWTAVAVGGASRWWEGVAPGNGPPTGVALGTAPCRGAHGWGRIGRGWGRGGIPNLRGGWRFGRDEWEELRRVRAPLPTWRGVGRTLPLLPRNGKGSGIFFSRFCDIFL